MFKLLKSTVSDRQFDEAGCIIDQEKGSIIWEYPRAFRRTESISKHSKSVQYCPASNDLESRIYVVSCPVDIDVGIEKDSKRGYVLVNNAGISSGVRSKNLNEMIHLVGRQEWRQEGYPIVQISTPYLFVSDHALYIHQVPPFLHYSEYRLGGTLICGRFPIHIWPRHLMWAFEWHDLTKSIKLRRGEAWFYVYFQGTDPNLNCRLYEAEMDKDIEAYCKSIRGVTNYVKRTYSLFKVAKERRPRRLLIKKRKI